eukprot:TRINITY_DN1701_c1_g1_i1.p2 TRINITY_DN1701_c1_g1~~TRINITY_DN1701_c1_g1_i1.p2  ORF type:complete len:532 (+),score=237.57 TRINITY_DN1701_c1_g1_i1:90-1685(+)
MAETTLFRSSFPPVSAPDVDITSFVLQEAASRGDRVALFEGLSGRSYTYGQISGLVKKAAAGLAARGIVKGSVIALYSPNLPEFVVPFLAAASLGAITALANPTYNAEELSKILKDAAPSLMVTVGPLLEQAKAANALANNVIKEFIVIGEAEGATPLAALFANDGKVPEVKISPQEDVVALPYSSGTTGYPKGVMLTHYNLVVNMLQLQSVEVETTGEDVLMGILPFFHIYGLAVVLLGGLRLGCKVVTMPRFEFEPFLKLIQEHKVSRAHLVPPIMLALAKHPLVDKYDLSSLQMVFSAAAPLGDDLSAAAEKRLKVPIKQGFGMTEASPATHMMPTEGIRKGSVGVLVPNMEAKIVHVESQQALPAGKEHVGELWLRGPNVMKGYLNNEAATKESIDEDGFYRTGDIGYFDSDLYFYVVDRLKELIKFKGFQVAPAELEDVLLSHPAVADCAVVGVLDEEAGELPRAFVVKSAGKEVTEAELKELVASKLSRFKHLAGGVVFIDAIPKSASGKILRRVLRDSPPAAKA